MTTARSSAIRTRLRLVISPYEKLGALVQKLSPPRKLPVFFVIVWIVSLAFSISDATRLTVLDSAAANEVKGSYPWYYCNNVGACGTANPCPTLKPVVVQHHSKHVRLRMSLEPITAKVGL